MGTTSIGIPLARATSASASALPTFSLPSEMSTMRLAVSGGRIESACRKPAARLLASRLPACSSSGTIERVSGCERISASRPTLTAATRSSGSCLPSMSACAKSRDCLSSGTGIERLRSSTNAVVSASPRRTHDGCANASVSKHTTIARRIKLNHHLPRSSLFRLRHASNTTGSTSSASKRKMGRSNCMKIETYETHKRNRRAPPLPRITHQSPLTAEVRRTQFSSCPNHKSPCALVRWCLSHSTRVHLAQGHMAQAHMVPEPKGT